VDLSSSHIAGIAANAQVPRAIDHKDKARASASQNVVDSTLHPVRAPEMGSDAVIALCSIDALLLTSGETGQVARNGPR